MSVKALYHWRHKFAPGKTMVTTLTGLFFLLVFPIHTAVGSDDETAPLPPHTHTLPIYQHTTSHGTLRWVTLPPSASLRLGLTNQLYQHPISTKAMATIPNIANKLSKKPSKEKAVLLAVINGGFFDPANGLTTSHIQLPGQNPLSPLSNPRLTQNKGLKPYMASILNRHELRQLTCESQSPQRHHQITQHHTPLPNGCSLNWSLGAGPLLLPTLSHHSGGFYAKNDQGNVTRNPINIYGRAARSAIGLTPSGEVWLILAQRLPNTPGSGWALPELANTLTSLGITQAMALDGGSSSSLWVSSAKGSQWFPGMWDKAGKPIKRQILSFLWIEATPLHSQPNKNTTTPSEKRPHEVK